MGNIFEGVLGFLVIILIVILFWVIPIWFGLKWAEIKGVSKLWMLFGFHPMTGWIAYLVLRYGIEPRKQCDKCKESIKIEAQICRYCGNQMSQEEIAVTIREYAERKK